MHAIFGSISVPDLSGKCHYNLGDVNIALFVQISAAGQDKLCADDMKSKYKPQYVESFKYALDEINEDDKILPNVTLGYVVMDICGRDLVALSRSLAFISESRFESNDNDNDTNEGQSILCGEEIVHFDVIGVVGPQSSREAVMVSSLLSLFKIPVLSTSATSDELTDKTRFEYFMRLVPPDRFQAQAMMEIIEHYNWTYISLLYSEGSYGENGMKQIEKEAKIRGICIEYTKKIPQDQDQEAYDIIINHLLEAYKARVVVLFVEEDEGPYLFKALEKRGVKDYFLWVSADSLADGNHGTAANGMITMSMTLGMSDSFRNHYKHLVPSNSSGNPWMSALWEMYYKCEWNNSTVPCEQYQYKPIVEFPVTEYASKQYDGAWVYAYALHSLVEDLCPHVFQNISLLKDCFDPELFLSHMKNVTFEGMSGKIKFDESGDMIGEYDLFQYVYNTSEGYGDNFKIGKWDKSTEDLIIHDDKVSWHMFSTRPEAHTVVAGIPESVCSKPCKDNEYAVQKELKCCWECMRCRENEIIVNDSGCAVCPENTWPKENDVTVCEVINPSYMRTGDIIPICLLSLAFIGIVGLVIVAFTFYKNRNTKLIKASGKELMSIIACGAMTAYLTILAFVSRPTTVLCHLSHIGFNVSVTLIYAPLMLKTNRVYRIFTNGKKGTKALRFTSSSGQLTLTAVFVMLQVRMHFNINMGED